MNAIFSKFFNLQLEKQNRIINASLKEFAKKGYSNASTNEIVKEAGISKGLLFHYFNNKKDLFLFLYDYCIELNKNELYKKINLDEMDFFKRFRQVNLIKMELLNKYPQMFRFLEVAYIENSSEVKEELDSRNKEMMKSGTSKVLEGIDVSKFREDLDISKVMNIIFWSFQGYSTELLEKAKYDPSKQIDYDRVFAEVDVYTEIFKSCFYKQ